jgi:hypothetical protein
MCELAEGSAEDVQRLPTPAIWDVLSNGNWYGLSRLARVDNLQAVSRQIEVGAIGLPGTDDYCGKQHFTRLYTRARDVALTHRNIKAGWPKTGLFPFDLDRVLRRFIHSKPSGILSKLLSSLVFVWALAEKGTRTAKK